MDDLQHNINPMYNAFDKVNFKISFWCLQIFKKHNKFRCFFVRFEDTKRTFQNELNFKKDEILRRRLWKTPMCESHFCSLKAHFSLHYCIISNFNFQYFFFRTSMPLLFIFLPIVYALTFKVVHTNVQTLLDVRLVGTLRSCEVPGLKNKQQEFFWILSRFIRFIKTSYYVSRGCILLILSIKVHTFWEGHKIYEL